jgi:hypothetical protein
MNSFNVWATVPVSDQPELTLVNWQVLQLPDGDRHFVGYVVENREGRVSSPIVKFDPASLRGITKTRRVYQLRGLPDVDSDGEYVWRAWIRINDVADWTDVTADVWDAHLLTKKEVP